MSNRYVKVGRETIPNNHTLWKQISSTWDKLKESQKSQQTMKGEWPEMRLVGRGQTSQSLSKQLEMLWKVKNECGNPEVKDLGLNSKKSAKSFKGLGGW